MHPDKFHSNTRSQQGGVCVQSSVCLNSFILQHNLTAIANAACGHAEVTSRSGRPAACSIGPRCFLAKSVLMLSSSGTKRRGSCETSSSSMSSVVTTPLVVRQCYWSLVCLQIVKDCQKSASTACKIPASYEQLSTCSQNPDCWIVSHWGVCNRRAPLSSPSTAVWELELRRVLVL